jgi:glycosyltransferase involved in cell wall biosynthesis
VSRLGLDGEVSLPGFAANPHALLSRAAVFALSSRWEGLPNALIEALACQVSPVATDCRSGPREILDGGRCGRLVPVDDAAALARAMLESLETPVERSRLAAAAEKYSVAQAVAGYLDVLMPGGLMAVDRVVPAR